MNTGGASKLFPTRYTNGLTDRLTIKGDRLTDQLTGSEADRRPDG